MISGLCLGFGPHSIPLFLLACTLLSFLRFWFNRHIDETCWVQLLDHFQETQCHSKVQFCCSFNSLPLTDTLNKVPLGYSLTENNIWNVQLRGFSRSPRDTIIIFTFIASVVVCLVGLFAWMCSSSLVQFARYLLWNGVWFLTSKPILYV